MMHLFYTTLIFCLLFLPVHLKRNDITPVDKMLYDMGLSVWNNRYQILENSREQWWMSSDMSEILEKHFEETTKMAEPEQWGLSCLQCRTAVTALKSTINQGLQFEDVRDFAVDVCYNVTPAMGWNGEIMCEGIIDVFGPHVYWVLNETNKDAREICEFHFACPIEEDLQRKVVHPKRKVARQENNISRLGPKNNKIMKIAHLTDVHLDEHYTPGAPSECEGLPICCRDYWPGTGSAGHWGTYDCGLPIPTLELMLNFIADMDVDLILNTGDTPNKALWEETQQGQLRQSELLAESIKKCLPDVPTHVSLGNHDTYPTNQYYGPSPYIQDLLHQLRVMYQDLANFTQEQIETFEDGGYYTTLLIPGLRLMAYNSEYSTKKNFYGVLLEETEDWNNMKQFMEDTFDYARANGEKLILITHHPMGGGFTFWHDFITDILSRNGDLVMLHLFGHTHKDNYKMELNEDGEAVHVNIITAAMTTRRNPTFRIFHVDTETMTPLWFDTYFINISRPVAEGEEPLIELMYSSMTDYNMADLTPESFNEFTQRLELNNTLFNEFRWNEYSRFESPEPCEDDCKKKYICERKTVSRETYSACLES